MRFIVLSFDEYGRGMIQVGEHVLEVTVRALDEDGHALIGVLNTFGGKKLSLLIVPRNCRITYGRKQCTVLFTCRFTCPTISGMPAILLPRAGLVRMGEGSDEVVEGG